MRIVAGFHRGRTITAPPSFKARPTTDFAKENLFNVLSNRYDFDEISFLDLFSGTGSISYEVSSRGCERVVSVEMNPNHLNFIRDTAMKLKMDGIQCVGGNVFVYLKSSMNEQFDIIFADPPYEMDGVDDLPDLILSKNIIKEGGLLVYEHSASHDFSDNPLYEQTRRYGSVNFTFFNPIK